MAKNNAPSFELNAFTNIVTKPAILTGPAGVPWYETLNCQNSVDMVYEYEQKAGEAFIGMGYFLKRIRDNKLYHELGYDNMATLAKTLFNMDESAVSRFVNLCERFSENNNSPVLDIKYKNYSQSQLIEMLSIKDEKIMDEVTPDMTVKEIREVKKKTVKEPTDFEIKAFFNVHLLKISKEEWADLKEYMIKKYGKGHAGGNSGMVDYKCSPRGISIYGSDEITWAKFVSRVYLLEDLIPDSIRSQEKIANEDDLPGQMELESDFPEYCPDNTLSEGSNPKPVETRANCDVAINSVDKNGIVAVQTAEEAKKPLVVRDNCLFDKTKECNIHNIKEVAKNCLDIDCKYDCCYSCDEECGARCNTSSAARTRSLEKVIIDGEFREISTEPMVTTTNTEHADIEEESSTIETLEIKTEEVEEPLLIEKEDVMIKYKCCSCYQQFILGEYAITGIAIGTPHCPYCGKINLEKLECAVPGEIENMGSMSIWSVHINIGR